MKTVRELLTAKCMEEDLHVQIDYTDEELFEYLTECCSLVQESSRDEHRWYFVLWNVNKVNFEGTDYFIEYMTYDPKGEDANAEDCGFTLNFDDMKFVYPQEVTTVVYK